MRYFLLCHGSNKKGSIGLLEEYLLGQKQEVVKLLHPLDDYAGQKTLLAVNGATATITERTPRGVWNLIEDFFLSLRQIWKHPFDIFIAATNFDSLPGIFAKYILRKNIKIIYYPRDFSENKYTSAIFNKIYYMVESLAVRYSDLIVSNTNRAAKRRQELGLDVAKSAVVPNGISYLDTERIQAKIINPNKFIYVGEVSKEHGLYSMLETLAPLIHHLVIIGDGDDLDRTLALCKRLHISYESYKGKEHGFVIDFLLNFGGFGLAPYNTASLWTYYCSPLKVTEYIVCGVPVIISSVPEIAAEISHKHLGIVYDTLDFGALSHALNVFETKSYEDKAKDFYKANNYDTLYQGILL